MAWSDQAVAAQKSQPNRAMLPAEERRLNGFLEFANGFNAPLFENMHGGRKSVETSVTAAILGVEKGGAAFGAAQVGAIRANPWAMPQCTINPNYEKMWHHDGSKASELGAKMSVCAVNSQGDIMERQTTALERKSARIPKGVAPPVPGAIRAREFSESVASVDVFPLKRAKY